MSDERRLGLVSVDGPVTDAAERLKAIFDKAEADPGYVARVQAERDKLAAEEAARAHWEERARLEGRGIPAKYIDHLLAGKLLDTTAMQTARAFLGDPEMRILVLSGSKGCGKTLAASWIAAQESPDVFFDRARYRATPVWPNDLHPRFIDAAQLARLPRYESEIMVPLERCSMLVIDDLGMEYADKKGAFHSLLDGLINSRYAARVRTVITTNVSAKVNPERPGEDFKARYGERIADRIREDGRFMEIAEPSLRGGR